MATRNVAASTVLGLLFLSLLAIYLIVAPSGLVAFLAVLIMLVSLIVAQSGNWRDVGILAGFAAAISLIAVGLIANLRYGTLGTAVALLIWAVVLGMIVSWTQRNVIVVPTDRAILVRNRYTGGSYILAGDVAPPLTPGIEMRISEIPLYELATDARVEKINTKRQNIDAIDLNIHYRVTNPKQALTGIPNRSEAQSTIAKDMGKKIEEARLDVAFWENLLNSQMKAEVDDIVRAVIFDNAFAQNPLEVAAKRTDLSDTVCEQLRKHVSRWGVDLIDLEIERVEINPDVMKSINKANIRIDTTEEKRLEAEREATRVALVGGAQAGVEATRVTKIVEVLQSSGIDLSTDDLRRIVTDAIHAAAEANLESILLRPPPESPPAKPAGK